MAPEPSVTSSQAAAGGGGGGFQTQRDLLRGSSKTWWALSAWVSVGFRAVVVQSGPPGQGGPGDRRGQTTEGCQGLLGSRDCHQELVRGLVSKELPCGIWEGDDSHVLNKGS